MAVTTTSWQSATVCDSNRQAFDARREQIAAHLPSPDRAWRWSWVQGLIDQQVLERARRKGYVEELTDREAWRRESEPGWWRTDPKWYAWCRDRYGLDEQQGPGVEMLTDPDADPVESRRAGPSTRPVRGDRRGSSGKSTQIDLTGESADREVFRRSVRREFERREACGSHADGSDDAASHAGQLTVEQALKVAATRSRWREDDVKLARPAGDAYPDTPGPSHVDVVG